MSKCSSFFQFFVSVGALFLAVASWAEIRSRRKSAPPVFLASGFFMLLCLLWSSTVISRDSKQVNFLLASGLFMLSYLLWSITVTSRDSKQVNFLSFWILYLVMSALKQYCHIAGFLAGKLPFELLDSLYCHVCFGAVLSHCGILSR